MATQTDGSWVRQVVGSEVGRATVVGGGLGAPAPSATAGLTCPWPVPYREMMLRRIEMKFGPVLAPEGTWKLICRAHLNEGRRDGVVYKNRAVYEGIGPRRRALGIRCRIGQPGAE